MLESFSAITKEKHYDNVKVNNNYPVPKSLREFQRFLGMCFYFRKFICNFSQIAKPLQDLNGKGFAFSFGSEQLRAFEELKMKLLDKPVLSIFSPTDPTELHCDGSSVGYGAVLMQKKSDGKFHPIL